MIESSNVFYQKNLFLYFNVNLTEYCYIGLNWQLVCIGSGNGLALDKRQNII